MKTNKHTTHDNGSTAPRPNDPNMCSMSNASSSSKDSSAGVSTNCRLAKPVSVESSVQLSVSACSCATSRPAAAFSFSTAASLASLCRFLSHAMLRSAPSAPAYRHRKYVYQDEVTTNENDKVIISATLCRSELYLLCISTRVYFCKLD